MNNKQYFSKSGIVLNTMLLIALAGGPGRADGQTIRIDLPSPVVVVAPPVVVAQDNYVYYPSYGVYYNTTRHQYAYLTDGVWVFRPEPLGVSPAVMLASPSVKMDFHDSPAHHHADMARKYPKDYRAARSDEKSDRHEEHRDK